MTWSQNNVLISASGRAVLADGGLVPILDRIESAYFWRNSAYQPEGWQTWAWTAPEVLEGSRPGPTLQGDVWAFACLILVRLFTMSWCAQSSIDFTQQLVASTPPYAKDGKDGRCAVIYYHKDQITPAYTSTTEVGLSTLWPRKHEIAAEIKGAFKDYPDLWELCQKCWDFDPSERPTCQDIREALEHQCFLIWREERESLFTLTQDDDQVDLSHLDDETLAKEKREQIEIEQKEMIEAHQRVYEAALATAEKMRQDIQRRRQGRSNSLGIARSVARGVQKGFRRAFSLN